MPFSINTTGHAELCTDQMVQDLMLEIEEFAGSDFDDATKIAEAKILAQHWLQEKIGRYILFKDIVDEAHDGDARPYLFVVRPPILTVTAVKWVEGATTTVLVANTDYWLYKDHIKLALPTVYGRKNYLVTYRSGISGSGTVSTQTAWTIAKVAARHLTLSIGSGASQGSAITAGPVSLKETFYSDGKYAPKLAGWTTDIDDWIKAKRGVKMRAVGKDRDLNRRRGRYYPRWDRWE
jgi:hypothetical protein